MQYLTKYTNEVVEKVRNGATAKELGLKPREYEYIKRYRIKGKGKGLKGNVATGETGRRSWHSHPIGFERLDKDGYILVKIAYPRVEKRKQFIEWEKYNAPTDKKTECLIFLDGDKTNCNIDNLFKIKRKYLGCINHYAPAGMPPNLRKTAIMSAILYLDAKEKKEKKIHKRNAERTPETNALVVSLHKQGLTSSQIAKKTGLSIPNIRWKIRVHNLRNE